MYSIMLTLSVMSTIEYCQNTCSSKLEVFSNRMNKTMFTQMNLVRPLSNATLTICIRSLLDKYRNKLFKKCNIRLRPSWQIRPMLIKNQQTQRNSLRAMQTISPLYLWKAWNFPLRPCKQELLHSLTIKTIIGIPKCSGKNASIWKKCCTIAAKKISQTLADHFAMQSGHFRAPAKSGKFRWKLQTNFCRKALILAVGVCEPKKSLDFFRCWRLQHFFRQVSVRSSFTLVVLFVSAGDR